MKLINPSLWVIGAAVMAAPWLILPAFHGAIPVFDYALLENLLVGWVLSLEGVLHRRD